MLSESIASSSHSGRLRANSMTRNAIPTTIAMAAISVGTFRRSFGAEGACIAAQGRTEQNRGNGQLGPETLYRDDGDSSPPRLWRCARNDTRLLPPAAAFRPSSLVRPRQSLPPILEKRRQQPPTLVL